MVHLNHQAMETVEASCRSSSGMDIQIHLASQLGDPIRQPWLRFGWTCPSWICPAFLKVPQESGHYHIHGSEFQKVIVWEEVFSFVCLDWRCISLQNIWHYLTVNRTILCSSSGFCLRTGTSYPTTFKHRGPNWGPFLSKHVFWHWAMALPSNHTVLRPQLVLISVLSFSSKACS